MRIFGYIIVFVLGLITWLVVSFPLGMATQLAGLKAHGVSYDRAIGTIWSGSLTNVRVGAQPIGQINVNTSLQRILKGQISVDVAAAGEAGSGAASLDFGFDRSVAIYNAVADLKVQKMAYLDQRLRQASSNATITLSEAVFLSDGRCKKASGNANTDLLTVIGQRWNWNGPEMVGNISCKEEGLLLQLNNASGPDSIQSNAHIRGMTGFELDARVITLNSGVAAALLNIGFQNEGGARYIYTKKIP